MSPRSQLYRNLAVAGLCLVAWGLLPACTGGGTEDRSTGAVTSRTTSTFVMIKTLSNRWGETAVLDAGTLTVCEPVTDSTFRPSTQGHRLVYCAVEIRNTGQDSIDYSEADFMLDDARVNSYRPATPTNDAERLGTGVLAPGEEAAGRIYYEIPGDATVYGVTCFAKWPPYSAIVRWGY